MYECNVFIGLLIECICMCMYVCMYAPWTLQVKILISSICAVVMECRYLLYVCYPCMYACMYVCMNERFLCNALRSRFFSAGLHDACVVFCKGSEYTAFNSSPEYLKKYVWSLKEKDPSPYSSCMRRHCAYTEPTKYNPEVTYHVDTSITRYHRHHTYIQYIHS